MFSLASLRKPLYYGKSNILTPQLASCPRRVLQPRKEELSATIKWRGLHNPFNSVPLVTNTKFLLTISMKYQTDEWWEWRKNINQEIASWSNTKFSKLKKVRTVLQTVRKLINGILKVKELRKPSLFKNLLMLLAVRISNYGCTQEVWRARKMRKSSSRRSRDQL